MDGSALETWHDFMVALVGAGAALAGLVFVAISINLTRVVAQAAVAARALEALIDLMLLPIIGLLALIPGQSMSWFGGELTVFGLVAAYAVIRLNLGPDRSKETSRSKQLSRLLLGLFAILPIVTAGVGVLAGWSGALYLIPVAMIAAIFAGMAGAWVLLVEILR